MISNYTDLKNEVADWAHRDDLTSKMDTFCQMAENIINNGYEHPNGRKIPGLRVIEMEKRLAQTFDATFFDLPADYLDMRAIEVEYQGRRNAIRQISSQQLDYLYSTGSGPPSAFTISSTQIEFRPGIEATDPYTGEIIYIAQVPTLVTNSTNDILTRYPAIYLAGMLLQVNVYLQDEEQTSVWFSALNSAIRGANGKGRYVLPSVEVA